ncbi:MAG: hypothetical protein AAF320_04015 [Myxococcota bacterium]
MKLRLLSFILLISIGCSRDPNGNQFNNPYPYSPNPATPLPGEPATPRLQAPGTGDTTGAACSTEREHIPKEQCQAAISEIKTHGDKHNCIKKSYLYCSKELFNAIKDIKDTNTKKVIVEGLSEYLDISPKQISDYIQQEDNIELVKLAVKKWGHSLSKDQTVDLFVNEEGSQEKQNAIRKILLDDHINRFQKENVEKLLEVAGKDTETDKMIIKIMLDTAHSYVMWSKFIVKPSYGSESQQLVFNELIKEKLHVYKLDDIQPLYDKAFQLIKSKPYAQYSSDEKKFLTGFLAVFYNISDSNRGTKSPVGTIATTSCPTLSGPCIRGVYNSLKSDVNASSWDKKQKVVDAIDDKIRALAP